MSGIAPIANFTPTNYLTQSGSAYVALIDGDVEVLQREGAKFAPRSQPHPNENMTIGIDPGHLFAGGVLTEVGHWTSGVTNNGGPPSNIMGLIGDLSGVAVGDLVIPYLYVSGILTIRTPTNTIVTSIDATTPNAGQIHMSNQATVSAGGPVVFCKPIGTVVTGNAHGTQILDGLQSTSGIFVGMTVTGTGVLGATTVTSVDSASQVHVSNNVTTGTGVTFTFGIPTPAAQPRIDRVCINLATGLPLWIEGTEAATPSPPAIPAGYLPCCQISLATSTTAITQTTNLSDERDLAGLALGAILGAPTTLSFKNRTINGDMRIDQRNSGASQTFTAGAAVAYSADRFYASCTGANVTGQRIAGSGADQFAYRFTGAASVTGILIGQRIEATNIYDQASQTVTLSAELANSLLTTVTWNAYYANSADNWSAKTLIATGTFTVSSTLARYSAQIALPSNAQNGVAIELSVGAQTSGTWTIGEVQLEPGGIMTAFDRRDVTSELARCQRYYEAGQTAFLIYAASAASFGNGVAFAAVKRSAPTLTGSGSGLSSGVSSAGADTATTNGFRGFLTLSSAAAGQYFGNLNWTASAEL
jgi:hypothetical protein